MVDVVATPAALAADATWPSWRGGARHGVGASTKLPTAWDDQHGVRWRASVPGRGNSSPIVWGEHLFLTSVTPTDAGGQATLLCFDRADGSLRWQQTVGVPSGPSHNKNGYASSTPATDGERVYAAFASLGLFAFDVHGRPVWQLPLTQATHEWGAAASPLVTDRLVIHVVDGASESAIIGVDKQTGQVAWRTARAGRGSWSSPVVVDSDAAGLTRTLVVVNGTGTVAGEVIAYDPTDGREVWKVRGTTDIPCPTAIVGEGLVVSTSGSNGPMFAIRPDGAGDVSDTHRAWHIPSGGAYVPTGVIDGGRLFTISDSGQVACLRVEDGTVLWRKRLQGTFSASLVAGAGNLYAVNERGDVYVFKSAEKFELVSTNRLRQACVATPAMAHGEIYLRTHEHLYCIADVQVASAEPADVAPAVAPSSTASPGDLESPSSAAAQGVGALSTQ